MPFSTPQDTDQHLDSSSASRLEPSGPFPLIAAFGRIVSNLIFPDKNIQEEANTPPKQAELLHSPGIAYVCSQGNPTPSLPLKPTNHSSHVQEASWITRLGRGDVVAARGVDQSISALPKSIDSQGDAPESSTATSLKPSGGLLVAAGALAVAELSHWRRGSASQEQDKQKQR